MNGCWYSIAGNVMVMCTAGPCDLVMHQWSDHPLQAYVSADALTFIHVMLINVHCLSALIGSIHLYPGGTTPACPASHHCLVTWPRARVIDLVSKQKHQLLRVSSPLHIGT
jgi:hypothetical protein